MSESGPAPDSLTERLDALARRLEELEKEDQALREKSKRDHATIDRLERENRELRRRLDKFIRLYFGGTRNEGLTPGQRELALQGMPAVSEQAPDARTVSPPGTG